MYQEDAKKGKLLILLVTQCLLLLPVNLDGESLLTYCKADNINGIILLPPTIIIRASAF